MKTIRKIQLMIFVFVTIVLILTLVPKFLSKSNEALTITTKTITPTLIKNTAGLTIPDNHLYLLAIPSSDVTTTVESNLPYDYIALLDQNMNVVLEASETYVENSELGVIDINTPLILGQRPKKSKKEENSFTYGLYSLTKNKWVIPRTYAYLEQLSDEYYCAYDENNIPYLFSKDGKRILEEAPVDSVSSFNIMDDHILLLNEITEITRIYTLSGKYVTELNAKYINLFDHYIIGSNPDEDPIIYKQDGSIVLTKNMILSNISEPIDENEIMSIYQFNEFSSLLVIQISHYYIICNLDGKIIKLLNQEEEPELNLGLIPTGYFIYSNDLSELSFYNLDGNRYLTSDGNDYTDFIDPNFFYYMKDNIMELYDVTLEEKRKLDVSIVSSPYLSAVHNNFTIICSHTDENYVLIYYKDKPIYEGEQTYIEQINDHIVVTNVNKDQPLEKSEDTGFTDYSSLMDSLHIIFNEEGEEIYRSKENEKILSINDNFLQIMRDNSIGITNYNGEFLCKIRLLPN